MGGGASKGTRVRQGTPGFDSVNPGASAAFKHTEKQLGELKRHQDELDRQKDAVQAAIEASLARLHTQTKTQLMGMTFLKQTAALELDEYERTTVKGLPTDLEHDAATAIQRHFRGRKGRSYFKREYSKQVQLNFNAAAMVPRFFRGKKERDRMRPLREAQRKDAAGVAVLQTVRPAAPGIYCGHSGGREHRGLSRALLFIMVSRMHLTRTLVFRSRATGQP